MGLWQLGDLSTSKYASPFAAPAGFVEFRLTYIFRALALFVVLFIGVQLRFEMNREQLGSVLDKFREVDAALADLK